MRFNQRFIRILVCTISAALLVAPVMFGQAQSGNIFGKVVDNQKAALPGVTVTLTGPGASQVFVTDTEGQFRYLNLSPGMYSISAELSGFGSVVRNNVQVNIGRNSNIELELTPALEQTITVTAPPSRRWSSTKSRQPATRGSSCSRFLAFSWTASTSAVTRAASSPSSCRRARRATRRCSTSMA